MALATLYNIPQNDEQFNVFSFSNQDEHNKIAMAIATRYSTTVQSYVLDPMPMNDLGTWLEQHQVLHNLMNSVDGGTSNDLTSVDFRDKNQLAEWIWMHAQEHFTAADFLGLT